jgi:nucleoid DNA-binding protein
VSNATKHDLIASVSKQTGLTQADTKIVVEEFLETISKYLEANKTIEIRGFGTFYAKIRKPRPARNPKTGDGRRRALVSFMRRSLRDRCDRTGHGAAAYGSRLTPHASRLADG